MALEEMQRFLVVGVFLMLGTSYVIGRVTQCDLCILLCLDAADSHSRMTRSIQGKVMNVTHATDESPFDFPIINDGMHMFKAHKYGPTRFMKGFNSPVKGEASCHYTKQDLAFLIQSATEATNFYKKNFHKLTLRQDGGVGLTILEGQLLKMKSERKDFMFQNMLIAAGTIAKQVFEMVIPLEKQKSVRQGIEIMAKNPEMLHPKSSNWKPYSVLSPYLGSFRNIGKEKEIVYPFLDFQCLVSLVHSCEVPFVCQKMYLETPYAQYMLRHQVLYLHFAQKKSCVEANPEPFANWKSLEAELCAKVYEENLYLAEHGYPIRFRDLFAEGIAFCGLAGYPNFLRGDWMREMISWQGNSGCFYDVYGDKRTTDAVVDGDYHVQGNVRIEKCLVHMTSVTLAALAVNLGFAHDNCPELLYAN